MGYSPRFARKMRNRSPETTLDVIDYEVKRQRISKIKKPLRLKDFPKVPSSLISKTKRKDFLKWLQTNMNLTPKQASHFSRLGFEKQLLMKRRLAGFIRTAKETSKAETGKALTTKQILKGIWSKMKNPTTGEFFKALRAYYRSKIGVRPNGFQKPDSKKAISKQASKA